MAQKKQNGSNGRGAGIKNGSPQNRKNYKPGGYSNYSFNSFNSFNSVNSGLAGSAGYARYSGYNVKNSGSRISNAGVLQNPGRVRDSGRYKERLNGNKTYPNKRNPIITGRELTTPLGRKSTVDAQRERARRIAAANVKEKIIVRSKIVPVEKKKIPVNIIFVVIITTIVFFLLTCSYTVLNEKNVAINKWRDKIIKEEQTSRILERELEIKNDLIYILNYAENELHMIQEDLLQKHYVSVNADDKAEIVRENNNIILDLPNIMSAITKK